MTPAQLATLKTDIQAQASLTSAVAAADWPTVAAFYNAVASPAVNVWREDIPLTEFVATVVPSEYVSLTALQQNTMRFYLLGDPVDASSANIRTVFSQLFAANTTTRGALTAMAQRPATALEKLFGTGGPPITSTLYGHVLTADEVQQAMR